MWSSSFAVKWMLRTAVIPMRWRASLPGCSLGLVAHGAGVYQGRAAIRRFFEEWWGLYEVSGAEAEEILDLGNGVSFAVVTLKGGPIGSGGEVRLRYAAVNVW